MKVNFEKVVLPCVINEVTLWHLAHGYIYDAVEVPSGRRIGVLYYTMLCGDGGVIHFETVPHVKLSSSTILYGFRKAISMLASMDVLFATIPAANRKLINIVCRLGFRVVKDGGFERSGEGSIVLLKYFGSKKGIFKEEPERKEDFYEYQKTKKHSSPDAG